MNDELQMTEQPQIQEQERGSDYNEAQRLVIGSDARVTLVKAGPGSGKSHTIIGRILHGPASPRNTLVVTYTTNAAKVLKNRLAQHGAEVFFAGTVHAFLLRLIRQFAAKVGYSARVGVLDAETADALLRKTADDNHYTGTITGLETQLRRGPTVNPKTAPEIVCAAYWRKLKESNVLDFASIIRLGTKLLADPKVIAEWRVESLAWDEAQDMADEHLAVFNAIPARWKLAVGDAKQSVFSFLGANVANIMQVAASRATVIPLMDNYRCPKSVCELANRLIAANPVHDETVSATDAEGTVELFDGGDEAKEGLIMARKINTLLAQEPESTVAVLVMTHAHRQQLEMLLQGYGVPVEKREDAVPPRDWFQTRALLNALSDPDNTLFGEALVRAWAPGNAEEIIRDAAMNLQSLNEASLHLPYLETASQAVDFIAAKKPTEQSLKRLQDALAVLAENGESSISDLQIALAERADDKEVLQAGKVRVLTYWAAKGSEADAVFLPALEQGILPSISQLRTEADLQEARRILYVGVTRAKKHLFLSHAGTRRPFHGKFTGKPEPAQPSQFLSEMGFNA